MIRNKTSYINIEDILYKNVQRWEVTCNIVTTMFYDNNLEMTLQFFIMVKITPGLEQLLLKDNSLSLRMIYCKK